MILNLTVLGFFKYFNFGVDSYNALAQSLGLESWQWNTFFRVILPLGISFYTFQAMSYTIDVYRGDAKAMKNFTDFSCFVSHVPAPGRRTDSEVFLPGRPTGEPHPHHREIRARRGLRRAGSGEEDPPGQSRGKVADTTFNAGSVGFSTPGSERSPTPSRSTSTSAPIPTWRSASG